MKAPALLASALLLSGCLFGSSQEISRTVVEARSARREARIDVEVVKLTSTAESERYWSEASLMVPGGRWHLTLGRAPTASAAFQIVSRGASVVWARDGARVIARAGGELPNTRWEGDGGWLALAYDDAYVISCDHLHLPSEASAVESVPGARDLAAIVLGAKREGSRRNHGLWEETAALTWATSGRPGATDVYLTYLEAWPGERGYAPIRLQYPKRIDDPAQAARARAIAARFEALAEQDPEYRIIAAELRRVSDGR